ncbi:MAG: cytochrome b5 domain-containing protein [Patescibacteria group bacterium]
MKEFFESFPVLVISIIATITGGTAVNKVVQEIKSTTPNNEQKVVEVKRVETTPSALPTLVVTEPAVNPTATPEVVQPTTPKNGQSATFTAATLALHNKPGDCYVAYKGIVYNVSSHPSWASCRHHGTSGGRDITSIFPHSTSYFLTLSKVGTISTSNATSPTKPSDDSHDDDSEDNEDEEHEDEREDEDENEVEIEDED